MSFYSANDAIYGSGEYGTASYDVVTPIISLASVSATGQVTAVNATISVTLIGASATGQIGTVTAANDSSLTLGSVSATGQVNTVFENPSEAITGVSATGSIGTIFAQAFYGANDAIYGTGRYGVAIYGSQSPSINLPTLQLIGTIETVQVGGQFEVDVTEKLESVSATGQLGNIQTIPKIPASVFATGELGTIKANPTEALDAVSATGNVGTLTNSNTHSLGSVVGTFTLDTGDTFAKTFNFLDAPSLVATGAIGTPEITTSEALLSVSATGQIGTVSPNTAAGVTGVEGELNPLKPFTASGDAQLSTAEKKFGTASLLLDGTGDFVTTSYTSSLLTSSEWGVDFWVYSSTLTSQTAHLWDGQNSNSGFALRISSGTLQVIKDGSIARSVTGQLSNDTWHHIRLQRRFAFSEVFVDGFLRGQQAGAGYNAHTYVIGAKENGSEEFTGYIDEFRASTPTGLSAVSFTPETEAYSLDGSTEALLHFDGTNGSTTITNEASNVITVTATGTANTTPTGVSATGAIEQVQVDGFEIDVQERLVSVSATGAIGSLTLHTSAGLTGVIGTFTVGTPTVTGVVTVFTASAYDRRNVANTLPKQTSSQRRAA